MDVNSIFKQLTRGFKLSTAESTLTIEEDQTNTVPNLQKARPADSQPVRKRKASETEPSSDIRLLSSLGPVSNKGKKTPLSQDRLLQTHKENVHRVRREQKIRVYGADIPDPAPSFAATGLHPRLLENVHYGTPTPIQTQAIPAMLLDREILACAPTGSGKTACFILPVLHHLLATAGSGVRAVILSPTRELAKQTHRECERLAAGLKVRAHVINNVHHAMARYKNSTKVDVIVATPKRLLIVLGEVPALLANVLWLVVDEADKLFEDGKRGFRKQLGDIYAACGPGTRHAMFSATYTATVEAWCRAHLDNVITVTVGLRNSAVDLVDQELLFVGGEAGKLLALRDLFLKGVDPPVLVFVQSKERARELCEELSFDHLNVDVIHADHPEQERDAAVASFRRGDVWVLICTELLGRGIDFVGVNLVVNYDFPLSAISYIHRIGRTGRAGRRGRAVTFFTEGDMASLRGVAQVLSTAGCAVPDYMLHLPRLGKKQRKQLEGKAPLRERILTEAPPELAKLENSEYDDEETNAAKKVEKSDKSVPQRGKGKGMTVRGREKGKGMTVRRREKYKKFKQKMKEKSRQRKEKASKLRAGKISEKIAEQRDNEEISSDEEEI